VRSPALRDWLRAVLPGLLEIETEILTWLRGVQDPGYPLAQYMSQVSYLDHHVGAVLDALREHGLYEQTLVVFTSPHGEALGESQAFFHHHCLLEAVLRVPLLIKPATQGAPGLGPVPGTRIGGIIDSIDVFPTVVEGLGLPPVANLPGVSRWRHVRDDSPIPEHDSFALEMGGAMAALATSSHLLLKALASYRLTDQWRWRAGQAGLFRLREPMDYLGNLLDTEAGLARNLEKRLAAWLTLPPPEEVSACRCNTGTGPSAEAFGRR
jgi:arylsulfatase A-like enzyme